MSTEDRIAEIRARESAATPGPWVYEPGEALHGPDPDAVRLHYVSTAVDVVDDDPPMSEFYSEADAQFVAASRQDVPFLLAEVERLQSYLSDADTARADASRVTDALIAERDRARATAVTLEQETARQTDVIQRSRDVHNQVDWYRVPGGDRLWPTKDDAAYFNGWTVDNFTADQVETVTICGACSHEDEWPSTISTDEYTVVDWPCATAAALAGEVPDGN